LKGNTVEKISIEQQFFNDLGALVFASRKAQVAQSKAAAAGQSVPAVDALPAPAAGLKTVSSAAAGPSALTEQKLLSLTEESLAAYLASPFKKELDEKRAKGAAGSHTGAAPGTSAATNKIRSGEEIFAGRKVAK
jgi:hypothetical protein